MYKFFVFSFLICFSLFSVADEGVSVGVMIAKLHQAQLQPIVDYCSETESSHKEKIVQAYQKASGTIGEAAKFLVDLAKEDGVDEIPKAEFDDVLEKISEFGEGIKATLVEKNQPEAICAQFYTSLTLRTKEELESGFKKAFEEYKEKTSRNKNNGNTEQDNAGQEQKAKPE